MIIYQNLFTAILIVKKRFRFHSDLKLLLRYAFTFKA